MLRRVGWGLADQALSSLTNFGLGIILARTVGAVEFGAFSLAFASYAVALGISRGLSTQPLMVRYSAGGELAWRNAAGAAAGISILVGVLSSLTAGAIALAADGPLRQAFAILAIILPGLLLQDCWRFALFARGRGDGAFANDLVWTVVLVPALAVSLAVAPGSIAGPLLAWGVAAAAGALYGLRQVSVRPRPSGARAWLRDHRDLAPRFVGEFLTTMAATQASIFALGALAGLSSAGALRAGQLLLGPLNILQQGIGLVAIPEGIRLLARSRSHLERGAIALGTCMAAAALAWGFAVHLLPSAVGTQILGANWGAAHTLLIPLTIAVAAGSFQSGAYITLRVLAAAGRSFRANLAASVLTVSGGFFGALFGGALGVAWAQAVTGATGAAIWWRESWAGLHDRPDGGARPSAGIAMAPWRRRPRHPIRPDQTRS